jgi:hypothetical protein
VVRVSRLAILDWKSNAVPVQSLNVLAISSKPSSKRNTPSKSRFLGLHISACGSTCSLMNCFVSSTSAICFVTPSTNFSNEHSSSLLQAYQSKSGWSDPRCAWILSNHVEYRRVPGCRTTVKTLYASPLGSS